MDLNPDFGFHRLDPFPVFRLSSALHMSFCDTWGLIPCYSPGSGEKAHSPGERPPMTGRTGVGPGLGVFLPDIDGNGTSSTSELKLV